MGQHGPIDAVRAQGVGHVHHAARNVRAAGATYPDDHADNPEGRGQRGVAALDGTFLAYAEILDQPGDETDRLPAVMRWR
jgi:hypothetical protein